MGSPQSIGPLSDCNQDQRYITIGEKDFIMETYPRFVRSVELSVSDQPHPYHEENSDIALKAWEEEVAKKPSLFNGLVMLDSAMNYQDDILEGTSHLVPYSTFLHWLQNPEGEGSHLFALGLIISKEGLPIVGRMADHTFNAGKCYSPSGSLDADDIVDGKIDLLANVERELGEETGLDLANAEIEAGFHMFKTNRNSIAVARCKFDLTAPEICAQINAFIASDPDAELSAVFAIEGKQNYDDNMSEYMVEILDWHFDQM